MIMMIIDCVKVNYLMVKKYKVKKMKMRIALLLLVLFVFGCDYNEKIGPQIRVNSAYGELVENGTYTYDYGVIKAGRVIDALFFIYNDGDEDLFLSEGSPIELIDLDGSAFNSVERPIWKISPKGWSRFRIRFEPTAVGIFTAKIMVESNSENDSHLEFFIIGGATNS